MKTLFRKKIEIKWPGTLSKQFSAKQLKLRGQGPKKVILGLFSKKIV